MRFTTQSGAHNKGWGAKGEAHNKRRDEAHNAGIGTRPAAHDGYAEAVDGAVQEKVGGHHH